MFGQRFLNALDVFVSSDRESLRPGDKWLDMVEDALRTCKIEIVLSSKDSIGRPWVNFEAGAGWILNTKIIPVCHSGMVPDNLPKPYDDLQSITANRPEGLRQLYKEVAEVLEMGVPQADFEKMANEVQELERMYLRVGGEIPIIEKPRILCAASENFSQNPALGFDQDIAVLEAAFPSQVTIERSLSSSRLRHLLSSQSFDILHLVLHVDPDSGDLIFSGVNPFTPQYQSTMSSLDTMPSKAFCEWVSEADTKLVLLATCHALALAVDVAVITNMVAINSEIDANAISKWGGCFYDLLAHQYPLFTAFERTQKNYPNIPMRLVRHHDVAFSL